MFSSDNRKMYILAALVFIVGIIVIVIQNKPKVYDDPSKGGVVEDIGIEISEIPDVDALEEPVKDVEESRIEVSTTAVKMTVKDIRENGASMYLVVDVGVGENRKESSITVEPDTVIYDYKLERVVGPYAIKEGVDVVYYGAIDYNAGNTPSEALILGVGEESIKFGRIGDVYKDKSNESYLVNIKGTGDMLRVTDLTTFKNATTDISMGGIRDVAPNSRVFYSPEKVESQIEGGVIYRIDKLFVVAQERDENQERKAD